MLLHSVRADCIGDAENDHELFERNHRDVGIVDDPKIAGFKPTHATNCRGGGTSRMQCAGNCGEAPSARNEITHLNYAGSITSR